MFAEVKELRQVVSSRHNQNLLRRAERYAGDGILLRSTSQRVTGRDRRLGVSCPEDYRLNHGKFYMPIKYKVLQY